MTLQTPAALYNSPRVDSGHILSLRGRAWAPDDAGVMNADMQRCIGKSGHALGCVDLKKWWAEREKGKGTYCVVIQSVLYRYFVGNFIVICAILSVYVFDWYVIGI